MRDTTESTAARLALLAVRVSIPPELSVGVGFESVMLDTAHGPVPREHAEAALARLAKPVLCTGSVVEHVLAVQCSPLSPGRAKAHRRIMDLLSSGAGIGMITQLAPNDVVTVRGGGEVLRLGPTAVIRWLTDYPLPPRVSVSGGPTEDQHDAGGSFILTISRPEDVDLAGVREYLETLGPS